LDLAFELDDTRETQLTVLVENAARWRLALEALTGLRVKDMHPRTDPEVSGIVVEVYRRAS
jgi:hypothetical protein